MSTIVHFEIPADDVERVKTFYTRMFGWKIEKYEASDYWMVTTTDAEGKDAVCGGIMKRQNPAQAITNYMDVESLDEASKKVTELGGKIIMPKTPVPGVGYFAVCGDTENNVFGIWENDPEAGVFSDPAEVFMAIMICAICSDDKYSVDEMRTVWFENEDLDIFRGKDLNQLESAVFRLFDRKSTEPRAFNDEEINLIVMSAVRMLSPIHREKAFRSAVKLAFADRNLDGLRVEIDGREKALLAKLEKGLGIAPEKAHAWIMDESKKI